MVEAMCTKFSHILHQFLIFQHIYCASSQQLSFLPFSIVLKPWLAVSGELQKGREAGAWKEGKKLFKTLKKEGVGMN